MARPFRRGLSIALLLCLTATASPPAAPGGGWSEAERGLILTLSPLPPAPRDSTNRLSGNPSAIALGRRLFFDRRLSRSGRTSCSTCHDPALLFSSATPLLPQDDGTLQPRHAPSLLDAAQSRWFFWDGRRDTLWAQVLEALSSDMGGNPAHVAAAAAHDPATRDALTFLEGAPTEDQALFVRVGKAIAAFVETLTTPQTRFDRYVAAMKTGRSVTADAQLAAGLRVFLREGQCGTCHNGPLLSDGEFHSTRLPPAAGEVAEDAGRFVGLYLLATAPYSAASRFSDDPQGARARHTRAQLRSRDSWGSFKTPSLRNVSHRPRFMHDGRFATLVEVIDHYSETPGATSMLHSDPAPAALHLTPQQKSDLAAFLRTL